MSQTVGISQKIKRAWLDALLDQLARTTDEAELRAFLDNHLKGDLPGTESRAKTAGIMLRIWSSVPAERIALRSRAVALLGRISGQERIWLHWGMAALAYPFFRDTAGVVGRLSALQDDFTSVQVQTRLVTTWGDRATSKEAAKKLLNSLVDWEVLRPAKARGNLLLGRKLTTTVPDLQLWLLEALLGASSADETEAQQLLRLPELFPFTINVGVADLRKHEGFNIHRQGLDMDMVALHKVKLEAPKPAKKRKKKAAVGGPSLFDEADDALGVAGPQWTLADVPYDAPIGECGKLAREGRFFGCIALADAIVESAVLLVWRLKVRKRKNQTADFAKALDALRSNSLIGEDRKGDIERLREGRQSMLLTSADNHILDETARTGLEVIRGLAKDFFGSTQREGVVIPDHPEYWSLAQAETPALAAT